MTSKISRHQEAAAIAWIESELKHSTNVNELSPPLPGNTATLCEFLRDGRALCLLANAIVVEHALGDEHALPKKLERAMHQLATFHSLERIHFFIRWCRNAIQLEEQHIFTSVQLLDDTNADAVFACIDALRQRFRPKFEADVADTNSPTTDENDDVTNYTTTPTPSALPTTTTSSSKLTAFLSKLPTETPAPASNARLSSTSSTGSSSVREFASSIISDFDDLQAEEREEENRSSSTSDSATTVSKLKLPLAFTAGANSSPTKEDEMVDTKPKLSSSSSSVKKLEIPPVFGRQRSNSNVEDTSSSSSTITSSSAEEPPKPTARSVSKLQIPAAFSSGASASSTVATPPPPPAPPSPKTMVPSSPRSKLELFTKGFSSPSPPPSPKKDPPPFDGSTIQNRTPAKLKIPAAFAPPAPPPPPKVKRPSKLSNFISAVEAANEVTARESPRVSIEQEPAVEEPKELIAAVEDEIAAVEEELKPDEQEEVSAPPPSQSQRSKLLAFLAATESPIVAAPPPVESQVEDAPPPADEYVLVEPEPVQVAKEEKQRVGEAEEQLEGEEHDEAPSVTVSASLASQPRASKLLAFLAATEPTTLSPASDAVVHQELEDEAPIALEFIEPEHLEVEEELVVEEAVVVEPAVVEHEVVEQIETPVAVSSAPPAQRSSKLLAFLAAVPPPLAEIEVEEAAHPVEEPTVKVAPPEEAIAHHVHHEEEEEEEHVYLSSHPHDDDDASTPMIDVSGEVVHEDLASPPPSPRHSQPRSPKQEAVRELFPEEQVEEPSAEVEAPVKEEVPVETVEEVVEEVAEVVEEKHVATAALSAPLEPTSTISEDAAESEALRQQLRHAAEAAEIQHTEMNALRQELVELRQRLLVEQAEAQAAQDAAVASARQEAVAAAGDQVRKHAAEVEELHSQLSSERREFEEQVQSSSQLAAERLVELERVKEELAEQLRQTQMAKDSEEAARYAAQLAFAARDEAEDQLEALRRAA